MLTILGRQNSANFQKLTWLCDECDIDYTREDVDDHATGFKLKPAANIPTVIDDGFVISESDAVLQYLCIKHALDAWYPAGVRATAHVRQWMDWASGDCHWTAEATWIATVLTSIDQRDPATIRAATEGLSKKLAMLDRHLAGSTYMAGDTITIGDLPLAIFTHRWFEISVGGEDHPNLRRWYDSIAARPMFMKNVVGST
jgi:glutathione S-transferase